MGPLSITLSVCVCVCVYFVCVCGILRYELPESMMRHNSGPSMQFVRELIGSCSAPI